MDFDKRLEQAIARGARAKDAEGRKQAQQSLSEEDLRILHSRHRLDLSEHVEECLRKLADHFPGFRFQTVVGEEGWGAKIVRDDVSLEPGRPVQNLYSRLELLVTPFGPARIVELVAKGTIRNKEILRRAHYKPLDQFDLESFTDVVDLWLLEYAEAFAARK